MLSEGARLTYPGSDTNQFNWLFCYTVILELQKNTVRIGNIKTFELQDQW